MYPIHTEYVADLDQRSKMIIFQLKPKTKPFVLRILTKFSMSKAVIRTVAIQKLSLSVYDISLFPLVNMAFNNTMKSGMKTAQFKKKCCFYVQLDLKISYLLCILNSHFFRRTIWPVVRKGPHQRHHQDEEQESPPKRKFFYRQQIDDNERQQRRRQQQHQRRYDWMDRESNRRQGERQYKEPVGEEKPLAVIHIFISDNQEHPAIVKQL